MERRESGLKIMIDQGPEGGKGEHLAGNWRESHPDIEHSKLQGFEACHVWGTARRLVWLEPGEEERKWEKSLK